MHAWSLRVDSRDLRASDSDQSKLCRAASTLDSPSSRLEQFLILYMVLFTRVRAPSSDPVDKLAAQFNDRKQARKLEKGAFRREARGSTVVRHSVEGARAASSAGTSFGGIPSAEPLLALKLFVGAFSEGESHITQS